MRFDFFFRMEGKNFNRDDVHYLTLDLDLEAEDLEELGWEAFLTEALTQAWAEGMSKGSHRSGCFEVQCDLGIFAHKDQNKINPDNLSKVTFKTWDELDALDAEEFLK